MTDALDWDQIEREARQIWLEARPFRKWRKLFFKRWRV